MTTAYTDTTYNGWTNYATWRVNLEILDGYRESWIDDCISDDTAPTDVELTDQLNEYVDDVLSNFGEITDGIALDYARSFVAQVNYYELACSFLDDLAERRAYEAS